MPWIVFLLSGTTYDDVKPEAETYVVRVDLRHTKWIWTMCGDIKQSL